MVDPSGFLMIEPKNRPNKTVIDDLTRSVTALLGTVEVGHGWLGWHECICSAESRTVDLWVEIGGEKYRTNSLAVHYAACHHDETRQQQMKLIESLKGSEEPAAEELYGWRPSGKVVPNHAVESRR